MHEAGEVDLPPFWTLVEEHGGELLRHARRLSGEAAEDVLHDALLKALRSYPRLQSSAHLRAWLFRVTTTTAFDHSDRLNRRSEVLTDEPPEGAWHDDEVDGFESLIEPLGEGRRAVLRMRFIEDRGYPEMAKALGCSEDAARQRVSSAVREMRRRLT